MRTSKHGKDVIVRFYSVELWAEDCPDGPYEPFTVSLSYEAKKIDGLDPNGSEALAQVLRRAVKIEAKEHGFAPGTTFRLHSARLFKSHFVPAAQAQ